MQWRGRVEPAYMARLLSAPEEEVLAALTEAGQIFLDPADNAWKASDEYLSGNVKEKLKQAALSGPAFRRNVEALERVQPEDLQPAAIEPRLGAVWIPALDVEAFIQQVLELKDCQVGYSAEAGAWSVKYGEWEARQNVKVTQEFGTSRMNAIELVQCALNVQVPTVRDRDPLTDKYFVNPDETLAAREKLGLIKERFAGWAFEDTERREKLCRIYNDLFNATRPRRFDGSHLKLPGFSRCFVLHPHQLDSVWRIVQSGNTGLFHVVGAGKTAVCVIASMELRRLGFINKPCHVVPNHMLAQYTAEFVRLYPNASVLMAGKDDLEGDRRRELVSRIATGDWDAVVITHSSFERIRMSPRFSERFIKEIIHEIEMAVRAEKSNDRSNRIVKQLEAMKKNWAVRLEKLSADQKKDDLLSWELLGIDALFVDEAHLHKNLYRFTKMTRVAGLPLTSSERAFDLFLKTRYTMQLHGHAQRGVVIQQGLQQDCRVGLGGTCRGLHFQAPPHAQAKLVRCGRGSVFDVAVDIRVGSPTYGKWFGTELSAENGKQMLIPTGFLHGFVTRDPDSELLYKCTDFYAPDCDGAVRFDDPTIGIDWGIDPQAAILSEKDAKAQTFATFVSPFTYEVRS